MTYYLYNLPSGLWAVEVGAVQHRAQTSVCGVWVCRAGSTEWPQGMLRQNIPGSRQASRKADPEKGGRWHYKLLKNPGFFFFFCLHYFSREVIILIVIRLRPNSGVSSFKICIFYHLLKQNVRRACQDSERWITPEQLSRAHLGWGILEDTWFVFIFVVVLGVVGMTTTDTSGCHKPQRELVIVIKRPARSDL